ARRRVAPGARALGGGAVGRTAGDRTAGHALRQPGVGVGAGVHGLRAERAEVLGELGVVEHAVRQGGPDAAHLGEQHPGVVRPVVGVAGGGPGDQGVEVGRDPTGAVHRRRRRHVVVDVGVGDLDGGLAGVRLPSGEQLEQHHARAVDVGAGVGPAGQHELGRQVGHRPDQQALGRGRGLRRHRLRQAEVGDLDLPAVGEQHVLGLDVAVHEPGVVRRGQRGEHGLDDLERPGRRHRRLAEDDVAERGAVDVLHDDVGPDGVPVEDGPALVEHGDDAGVGEPGGGAGLPVELAGELGVVAQPDVHDLDGDGAGQPGVDGLVDGRHPASGEALGDLVATVEDLADQGVADARHGHACSRHGGDDGRVGLGREHRPRPLLPPGGRAVRPPPAAAHRSRMPHQTVRAAGPGTDRGRPGVLPGQK
ncbi:MAG: hypothetical protein AVDCRST_MAG48-175, partial [uncultured Friedmanniella sp.]